MKTQRRVKKIYLQKLIIFLAGIFASLHSHLIPVTEIKSSWCPNKTASKGRESFAIADHPHASVRVLLFPWLGLVQSYTESCAVQAQTWEPASPPWMSLKLTVSFEILLSPALPLCE